MSLSLFWRWPYICILFISIIMSIHCIQSFSKSIFQFNRVQKVASENFVRTRRTPKQQVRCHSLDLSFIDKQTSLRYVFSSLNCCCFCSRIFLSWSAAFRSEVFSYSQLYLWIPNEGAPKPVEVIVLHLFTIVKMIVIKFSLCFLLALRYGPMICPHPDGWIRI